MSEYSLNQAQKQAVEYANGSLLIVAGAGTGKTSVITHKIAYLINKGLAKPEQILALTFTDKTAEEMESRVDKMINLGYSDIQISTFHSFCQRLLEQYGMDIGLSNNFKLASEAQAWMLLKQNFDRLNLDYYKPIGSPYSHLKELLTHFSKCKDELISPEDYLALAKNIKLSKDEAITEEKNRLSELANAYHVYNKLLLDNALLDFGDLIFYCVKLLQARPAIAKQLKSKYKFILVDEFQDVNWAQYQLVRLLADSNASLTVVGDDDQSIYAFRGASVSNILRFKDDFPDAKEIVLNQNYRSGQQILDLSYQLIQNNNPDRLEVKLKLDKKLKSSVNYESKTNFFTALTGTNEAEYVAKQIVNLKNGDNSLAWDDFAILVRAANHADAFLLELQKQGIPHEFLSSAGLYKQPIILDCVSFLRLVINQHESLHFYRLLNLPFLNINDDDLHKLIHLEKKLYLSLLEAAKNAKFNGLTDQGVNSINLLLNCVLRGQFEAKNAKPSVVLYNFLEQIGYLKYLVTRQKAGDRQQIRQLYYLRQLFNILNEFEQITPDPSVYAFVDHFNSLIEAGDKGNKYQLGDTPDSVNILTVHSAKGLEYKNVFVVNLAEDRFPTRHRGGGIEVPLELVKEQLPQGNSHLEEERRLLYVAITRAKNNLYLTHALNYGGVKTKKMSRFLAELNYLPGQVTQDAQIIEPKILKINETTGQFKYQPPEAFSYSQIKTYLTCPYQYKLGNILKIPTKGSAYFSFGQTLHSTLYEFYSLIKNSSGQNQASLFTNGANNNQAKIPNLEELLKIYHAKWIPDWYVSLSQREEYYKKGKTALTRFYKKNDPNWVVPLFMEASFKIKIGDYFLRGRIDRIDKLPENKLNIIDYKTGEPKKKLSPDDKAQLIIYQLAAEQLEQFNKIAPIGKLTYYYLEDDSQMSFLANKQETDNIAKKILTAINNIYAGKFSATPDKHDCKNCSFNQICEFKI